MTCSKMLSRDLEKLEDQYLRKCKSVEVIVNSSPTEERINMWNNCHKALEQVRRLRAVFERTF